MKIYFDNIIYSWQNFGGISVVWTELLKRIVKSNLSYFVLEYPGRFNNNLRSALSIPPNNILFRKSFPLRVKRYFPLFVKESNPFIFHSSYYRTCSNPNAINVITIHDFTYEKYFYGIKSKLHSLVKFCAIRNSDYIICISHNTKRDLLKYVPEITPDRIKVIYNGVSPIFRVLDEKSRFNISDVDPYLVYVGSRVEYKNFNIALECASLLGMKLIIVGNKLDKKEQQKVFAKLHGNYLEKGFVCDEELNFLYNNAFALIYPSSYEGFGLPVIEAQRAGCPVVAMNKSSIPEIMGSMEMLVDVEDPMLYVNKINKLKDPLVRKKIIEDGLINSQRFSWDKMFEEYINLYELIQNQEIH
jgi:glycosyltransferase involved in cell wall biosynthesis